MPGLQKTLFILVIWLLSGSSISAAPSPYIRIQPVKIINETKRERLVYWQPCGSEFQGIILGGSQKQPKIGAVLSFPQSQCLSASEKRVIPLRGLLSQKLIRKAMSFNPLHESQRLMWLPTENTYIHRQQLYSNYRTYCSKPLGQVVKKVGSGLSVAVLGTKSPSTCPLMTKTTKFRGLSKYIQNVHISRDSHKPYRTLLRPIRQGSITRHQSYTELRYLRYCHEAPIGLVKKSGKFAVLVAQYSRDICAPGVVPRSWAAFQTKLFQSQLADDNLISFQSLPNTPLSLVSPNSIAMKANKLQITTPRACPGYQGLVYRETSDTILVSTLRPLTQSPCKNKPTRVSLKLSGFAEESRQVAPLRIVY
ncbi:hypothetical protein [Pseudobacteriovorax antillogorgiicola]|uniref:Uncharacterized protein n=1 Tax=Pseudobacteriovorax antillogorgiicola TaxID=1513793 RepID=A0A1Y6CQY4_9BACT|nr:hypothetical protein [Pseudobacteriovorax antillogorgiicola]TCS46685.1 hypothetical protein EDD56_12361 [Pseudobacteriovorax antillogorgiicola]SMF66727.1 hypothetical protein SAMN06296036_12361 [Pseudobacteriovorax antillogorgiicola]